MADFPARFDEFLDEFRDAHPVRLSEAFRLARGQCKEFPTPADVRAIFERIKPGPEELAEREARTEASRGRLLAQYAVPRIKLLPSVLDEKVALRPKREIRQLTPEESEARLRELMAQREILLRPKEEKL